MKGGNENWCAHTVAFSDLVKYIPEGVFKAYTGALAIQAQATRLTGVSFRILTGKDVTHGNSSRFLAELSDYTAVRLVH